MAGIEERKYKNQKTAILCHNWPLNQKKVARKIYTYTDFGREICIKFYFKDYSKFHLSGPALSDRSTRTKDDTNRPMGLTQRWSRLLNRGKRPIEVKITVIERGKQIRDFENRPLNTGWPPYTGSTVSFSWNDLCFAVSFKTIYFWGRIKKQRSFVEDRERHSLTPPKSGC